MMRRGQQRRIKNLKWDSLHYFLSVLLYCKSNFRQTDHLHSRTPLCVARTCFLLAMFGSQILFGSGEMSERHLVESSDRWNNMLTSISSEISIWMLEEMSHIGSSPTRIWGNTLRPALTASRLFSWFEGHLLAFLIQGQPC